MAELVYRQDFLLPWVASSKEDSRFKKILLHMLMGFTLFAVAVPWLPVPEPVLEDKAQPPAQLARVILEPKPLVKPPPPKPKPIKPKVVRAKPKPVKPKPIVKPKPKPKPVDLVKQAREKAAVAGVLAFQDDLQAMRESIDVSQVTKSDLTRGAAESAKLERAVITSGKTSSGGIQTAALSRDTGGIALSARQTTTIKSTAGSGGRSVKSRKNTSAVTGGRSDEAIRRMMDSNKGAVFSIYNRALRSNPALQGRLVFEMVIEPSGAISAVKLLSSELADSALENKLLARIRLIRFPAASVLKTRVNYSFDFLPY